jgi:hypothetical protein
MHLWRGLTLVALLILAPVASARAEAALQDFFGTYTGYGFAQDESGPFINTPRDFELTIAPLAPDGFQITWTTIKRKGTSPNDLAAEMSRSSASFLPAGGPGLYHAAGNADPLAGGALMWARLAGDILYVYRAVVDPDGVPELHVYRRMWTAKGLELYFTAARDGVVVRSVRGRYARQ